MSYKMLYVVRGLPGSGKSTLAETLSTELNCPHFEEDMWLYTPSGEYVWTDERMAVAVASCQSACEERMIQGYWNSLVVSNVFEDEAQLDPYQKLADKYGYAVTYIVVENRRGGQNIHNVPDEALDQMRADFQVRL